MMSLYSNWKNNNPMPIVIKQKKTRVDVYRVHKDIGDGPFDPKKDLGEKIFVSYPLKDMSGFIFEPKINNQARAFFVVKSKDVYIIRIKIYQKRIKSRDVYAWTREYVIDPQSFVGDQMRFDV